MRKKPKTEEQMMEVSTPRGALQDAFRVSSLRWALASKPVIVYWLMRIPIQATYAGDAVVAQPGVPVPSLNTPKGVSNCCD